jgi:hypothetical protein
MNIAKKGVKSVMKYGNSLKERVRMNQAPIRFGGEWQEWMATPRQREQSPN